MQYDQDVEASLNTFKKYHEEIINKKEIPVLNNSQVVVVVVLGFKMLLTSQVISVTFYSEHEKTDKFCSEALISACSSFICRKSTTGDPWLYFPSEGSHIQDFYALKKSIDPSRM